MPQPQSQSAGGIWSRTLKSSATGKTLTVDTITIGSGGTRLSVEESCTFATDNLNVTRTALSGSGNVARPSRSRPAKLLAPVPYDN